MNCNNKMDLSEFRKLLERESPYPLSDEIFNLIISNSETLHFSKGEAIVDIGEIGRAHV